MSFVHFFIPHHSNNHRPRAIHHSTLTFYIAAVLFLQLVLSTISTYHPQILGIATDISVEKLLELTNQERQKAGIAPLVLNPQLAQAAMGKANDMFASNYWAHNSPSGKTPWDFITGAGYRFTYAGENLAKDFSNSPGVVSAWMTSPTHRANMVKSEYKEVGFAVVNGRLNGEETTLVVQEFGAPQGSFFVASNPEPVGPTTVPTPISQPTPTLIPTQLAAGAPRFAGAATKQSIFTLKQTSLLLFIVFLLGVFVIDGVHYMRMKTARRSGHNTAHILFLGGVLVAIWYSAIGVIL